MPKPEGRLSPAQYEILEAIWNVGPPGATRMQIWERISKKRRVVRTTIVNLVDRLHARGWLERIEEDGSLLFWPTADRSEIEADVAEDFVDCFFGGSASQLIMSLFGRDKIQPEDVERLRNVYEEQIAKHKRKRPARRKRKR